MSRNCHGTRVTTAALITAVTLSASTPIAFASTSSVADSSHLSRLETLVFRTPLAAFVRIASRPTNADSSFDWSTDHCSAPLVGSTGRSFDFTAACDRHDFAYRNFKRAESTDQQRSRIWNSQMRHRIDLQFRRDMNDHCSSRAVTDRATCRMWSEVFFRLVRVAGGP